MIDQQTAVAEIVSRLPLRHRLAAVKAAGVMSEWKTPLEKINRAYIPHLNSTARTQIYYGGSSSGKSVFLAQRDVIDMMRGGRNFLICRAVARTIRKSVFAEIVKVIRQWGLNGRFRVNKSEMVITCDNGYQFLFAGLDDTEKLKSITPEKGVITDVRIEEATESQGDDIKQLIRRQRGGDPDVPKRLTMSFNPILQSHHLYKTYFAPIGWADDQTQHSGDGLTILKTTYKDNQFLTQDDIDVLENETDPYWHNVYTLGNWGVLGDVIFTNWKVQDLSGMERQWTNRRNGLDFGYANDPNALTCSHYDTKRKRIYVFNEWSSLGMTNDLIADSILPLVERDPVRCDSSEPKSIAELNRHGIRALGVKKGRDSVLHGIQWLQQQEIIIDKSCLSTINEFQLYQWKKDKNGDSLPQPVGKNDHMIDALRYAYEDDMVATSTWDDVQGLGETDIKSKWG